MTDRATNVQAIVELFDREQQDLAWASFVDAHITPKRLYELASGTGPTSAEEQHVSECESCQRLLNTFRTPPPSPIHLCNDEQQRDESTVPAWVRNYFHTTAHTLFPDGTVGLGSWQFGLLRRIQESDPTNARELMHSLVDAIEVHLGNFLKQSNLMLVCFGREMRRLGTHLASRIASDTEHAPHVVLAHDYYRPTFVCRAREFENANVVVLVDVSRSGRTLTSLLDECGRFPVKSLRGISLVGKSSIPRDERITSVWSEPVRSRISLEEHARQFGGEVERFEPNAGTVVPSIAVPRRRANRKRFVLDDDLIKHIHSCNALKHNYEIAGQRYAYAVNVLDLLKSEESCDFILSRAQQSLGDLTLQNTCLLYQSTRAARAGKIARLIGKRMGLPVIGIGKRGGPFRLSDAQSLKLAGYDALVLVDAAVRTGDSMSAAVEALHDCWLKPERLVGFSILDALQRKPKMELERELGIELRSLFRLPMSPPTEEVRHWTKSRKALVAERLETKSNFDNVVGAIGDYLTPRRGFQRSVERCSISETREAIDRATATPDEVATLQSISAACLTGTAGPLRHLSVASVVQDAGVQDVLLGVMYNSMNPSFKEVAAFGLATANNYEWMEKDWLTCNRAFLSSPTQAWKAVPVIQCEMLLKGRSKEAEDFRASIEQFRRSLDARGQLSLPGMEDAKSRGGDMRLRDRLDVMHEAATCMKGELIPEYDSQHVNSAL